MLRTVEYENPLPLPSLSPRISDGLKQLWVKHQRTGTEWIGAAINTSRGLEILLLGHQSAHSVSVPIIDLFSNCNRFHGKIDEEAVRSEQAENEMGFRCTPDEEGHTFQGQLLYLLPPDICLKHPYIKKLLLAQGEMVISTEDLLGIAHSHSQKDPFSHLPSLKDLRQVVLGSLSIPTYELIISGMTFSLLIKSKDTPNYYLNPNRRTYLINQTESDDTELAVGKTYLEVLKENCRKYHFGLFEGNLETGLSLQPVFKN